MRKKNDLLRKNQCLLLVFVVTILPIYITLKIDIRNKSIFYDYNNNDNSNILEAFSYFNNSNSRNVENEFPLSLKGYRLTESGKSKNKGENNDLDDFDIGRAEDKKNNTLIKNLDLNQEKILNFEKNPILDENFFSKIRYLQESDSYYIDHPYDKIYGSATQIQCLQEKNCFIPNKCILNNTVCNCSIDYANFFPKDKSNSSQDDTIYCTYERKRQLTAFILTIFFNFGVAQFYIHHISIAFIKLAIALISIMFIPFAVFYKNPLLSMMVGLFFCFIISIWGLIDLILFGINYYNDGNNVPLLPW